MPDLEIWLDLGLKMKLTIVGEIKGWGTKLGHAGGSWLRLMTFPITLNF
jgi:hypothetical protein